MGLASLPVVPASSPKEFAVKKPPGEDGINAELRQLTKATQALRCDLEALLRPAKPTRGSALLIGRRAAKRAVQESVSSPKRGASKRP